LIDILGDDLPPMAMKYIMAAAPHMLNYGWDYLKQTRPAKYLLGKLREICGIDLNDDEYGYNKFTYDASMK